MAGKCLIIFICLCLLFTLAPAAPAQAETLEEYKERIKKEQEEAERKRKEQHDKDGSTEGGCGCLGGLFRAGVETGCFESFFTLFFTLLIDVRYADYPFAPERGYDFSAYPERDEAGVPVKDIGNKFWMGQVSLAGSYFFGAEVPILDLQALAQVDVTAFHLNVFYQRFWEVTGAALGTFSANAGVTLPLGNVSLSFYGGLFAQEGWPAYVSFGTSGRIFIPGGFVIGWYTLFSFYDYYYFIVASPSLEFAVGRFTLGIGFDYVNYYNFTRFGPGVKTSVWF